ncbi:hypothetical protein ACCO45_010841 [Purpureocillium lilacinum]|uniref:Uncharacterized protein n=1 Tax=Purpureocillium lilacinum TaxID=33203 RepID=A0ACC4DGW3_PURLI
MVQGVPCVDDAICLVAQALPLKADASLPQTAFADPMACQMPDSATQGRHIFDPGPHLAVKDGRWTLASAYQLGGVPWWVADGWGWAELTALEPQAPVARAICQNLVAPSYDCPSGRNLARQDQNHPRLSPTTTSIKAIVEPSRAAIMYCWERHLDLVAAQTAPLPLRLPCQIRQFPQGPSLKLAARHDERSFARYTTLSTEAVLISSSRQCRVFQIKARRLSPRVASGREEGTEVGACHTTGSGCQVPRLQAVDIGGIVYEKPDGVEPPLTEAGHLRQCIDCLDNSGPERDVRLSVSGVATTGNASYHRMKLPVRVGRPADRVAEVVARSRVGGGWGASMRTLAPLDRRQLAAMYRHEHDVGAQNKLPAKRVRPGEERGGKGTGLIPPEEARPCPTRVSEGG